MSNSGYARVPHFVLEALEKGLIDIVQYAALTAMYHWADYGTGRIQSFSAERLLVLFHEKVNKKSMRRMQRKLKALRLAGWFTWNYKLGVEQPYDVWMSNYFESFEATNSQNVAPSSEKSVAANVAAPQPVENTTKPVTAIAYPSGLGAGRDENVAANVATEGVRQLSLNIKADREKQQQTTNPVPPPESEAAVKDLATFVYGLSQGYVLSTSGANAILSDYTAIEFKYAFVEWFYSKVIAENPSRTALGNFLYPRKYTDKGSGQNFTEGEEYKGIIHARRVRNGGSPDVPNLKAPAKWSDAMEALAVGFDGDDSEEMVESGVDRPVERP
jgi:hypothetical protein